MDYAVITAVGQDRLGIMDDIAGAIAGSGGNIEETKAAVLGGEFAVIMLVSGKAGLSASLEAALVGSKAAAGLSVTVKETKGPSPASGIPYLVETVSLDTPGIVQAITAVLRSRGFNVEDLESLTEAAPWTGAPLFRMKIRVIAPSGARLAGLREDLARAAAEHDLDVSVRPLISGSQEL